MLTSLGVAAVPVRHAKEISDVSGLIIPGGESTVMDKLSRLFGLAEPIKAAIAAGLPVYGTCAGLIMLADRVLDSIDGQQTLGGLDVTVRRNAFGSQLDSFETDLDIPEMGEPAVHAVFIRAPVVESVGELVTIVSALDDGRIVAVQQGNLLGTSFHPEITGETRFHERFITMVEDAHFR
ncbi:MAG: pdxT [Glaciihabitans sp.]|nr:pdxT [Glaciihabitans sp.]